MCYVSMCGPDEVMVKSGWFWSPGKGPKFIRGGSTFVLMGLQQIQKMNLNTMTLIITSKSK